VCDVDDQRYGPDGGDGWIWWSARTATVALIVRDGRVTDTPPWARRWAMGRDAAVLWRAGSREGADLRWFPDPE
jgi:hypothetical protein